MPLLENNITPSIPESDDEEQQQNGKEFQWGDGGKMSKKTEKEVMKLINQKYQFPGFNILLYAEEQIFKYASAKETREENRDILY